MKRLLHLVRAIVCLFLVSASLEAKNIRIASPGGRLAVNLRTGQGPLHWTVDCDGQPLFTVSDVSLTLGTQVLGGAAVLLQLARNGGFAAVIE